MDYYPRRNMGMSWGNRTKRDGTFVIEHKDGDPDGPIRVNFARQGYEYSNLNKSYAWGSAGLKFMMRRALEVQIVVTDSKSGDAIEDYAVRCFPAPGSRSRLSGQDYLVRHRGHHPGGKLTITGITRGSNILLVEPLGDTWETSAFIPFELGNQGAALLHVRLSPQVSRMLLVRNGKDEPVVGTKVELLKPITEHEIDLNTMVLPMTQLWAYSGQNKAVRLMSGSTDALGKLLLRGPGQTTLALRLTGPGHQPIVVSGLTLATDA